MPDKNWQFELEEYIKQGEPDRAEKSEAWQTAIGLQAVDGLKTSEYLLDTAKDHIEGKITIDEAQKRIHSYYEQRTTRTEIEKGLVELRLEKDVAKGKEKKAIAESIKKAEESVEAMKVARKSMLKYNSSYAEGLQANQ